jgi:tetratricopeptide (TPR) repeat protein
LLLALPVHAAEEAPAPANQIEMSFALGQRLGEVIALMDAGKLDEASAALMTLITSLEQASAYEKLVLLQTSANLNVARQRPRDAAADYEAILRLDDVPAADRLSSATMAAQLYIGLSEWGAGLEQLLTINDMEGGANMETLFRIAFAYAQLGQVREAIPFMEQALVIGGAAAGEPYYLNMAVLYMSAGDNAKAINIYEEVLGRWPQSAQRELVASNLAALHVKVGNNAQARARLEALIRDFPNSAQLGTWQQSLTALRTMP